MHLRVSVLCLPPALLAFVYARIQQTAATLDGQHCFAAYISLIVNPRPRQQDTSPRPEISSVWVLIAMCMYRLRWQEND